MKPFLFVVFFYIKATGINQLNLNHSDVGPYLRHSLGHLAANGQPLDECACSNKGPRNLSFELPGHVSKGLELVGVLADTLQIVLRDGILRVEQREHAFQQPRPKVVEHFLQVDVSPRVVALQLSEQVLENLRVLHVRFAVSPHKHLVQGALRVLQ